MWGRLVLNAATTAKPLPSATTKFGEVGLTLKMPFIELMKWFYTESVKTFHRGEVTGRISRLYIVLCLAGFLHLTCTYSCPNAF